MTGVLTLSVLLLWLMACALCMSWFGAAKRRPAPYHGRTHGDEEGSTFWLRVFILSCVALWALWVWAAH